MSALIQLKESTRYPGLFVRKYKNKVFYDNLWHESDDLLESRGHVFTKDGRCVVRPFTKIFNRFENGADIDRDHECLWVRKVNGFMAAATYVPEVDDVVISTTGSLDSDFTEMAREVIPKRFVDSLRTEPLAGTKTFMFEIVHPNDPHIIKEDMGAYLIGCRMVDICTSYTTNVFNEGVLDTIAHHFGMLRPEWGIGRFSSTVQMAKECNHEGYVVYDQESEMALKIKSPYYLMVKALARRKDIETLDKSKIDEEFYFVVDSIKEYGVEKFGALEEQERITFIEQIVENSYGS